MESRASSFAGEQQSMLYTCRGANKICFTLAGEQQICFTLAGEHFCRGALKYAGCHFATAYCVWKNAMRRTLFLFIYNGLDFIRGWLLCEIWPRIGKLFPFDFWLSILHPDSCHVGQKSTKKCSDNWKDSSDGGSRNFVEEALIIKGDSDNCSHPGAGATKSQTMNPGMRFEHARSKYWLQIDWLLKLFNF